MLKKYKRKRSNDMLLKLFLVIKLMETIRFASLHDYEDYARRKLSKPMFQHLKGIERPSDHLTDFYNIKLRLRGMANLKNFKGIGTHVLLKEVASPICVGPLPPISDLKMVSNVNSNHAYMIQNVCKSLGQLCCVPLDKGYTIDESNYVYIQPTKGMDVTKLVIPKCKGIVIECGYEAPN
jgi:hypothetical protein